MKKSFLLIIALIVSACCVAQEKPTFPFQGGSDVMEHFFRDSLKVSSMIKYEKASGVVVIKFTADDKGVVKNLVIYYADDAVLIQPATEALRKSSHKWIIPFKEKMHDFVITFLIRFDLPETATADVKNQFLKFYSTRKPIVARDQTPLDMTTLLPTIVVDYTVDQ